MDQLVDLLLGGHPLEPAARDALAVALTERIAEARAEWPQLVVDDRRFVAFLAERIDRDRSQLLCWLSHLCVSDLYLVCACVAGDNAAKTEFEAAYRQLMRAAIARIDLPADAAAELLQQLLARLLVGDGKSAPLVAKYAGRGRLQAWLRVCCVRAALNRAQRGNREIPVDEQVFEAIPDPSYDPELLFLKATYREAFRQAFRQALAAQEKRQRSLLQLSYIDGLSIDDLAPIFGVHRATAARWLQKARAELLVGTRQRLLSALSVEEPELDSIIALISSRLDFSFRSVLADHPQTLSEQRGANERGKDQSR
ncbi:MAG: sigma-70 family RNA polymerase sigma factor [Deltaproteobacteria bacterium]|nr:sigma-70 family RNA polymerase sigma factor [Deltaproteobacteria bacterium]